jgi:hypothetical protein
MTTPACSRKDSGRLTLIEMILVRLEIVLIASCVRWGLHSYGWRGAVGGLIFVFIVLPLDAFALCLLVSLVYTGMPSYPICRIGKCRSSNCQARLLENGGYALFCRCGTPYRKRGRRFMKCSPTVPSALTRYGEHSEDGFQRVSEYAGGLWGILDEVGYPEAIVGSNRWSRFARRFCARCLSAKLQFSALQNCHC